MPGLAAEVLPQSLVPDSLATASTVAMAAGVFGTWSRGESTVKDVFEGMALDDVVAAVAAGEIISVLSAEQGRVRSNQPSPAE